MTKSYLKRAAKNSTNAERVLREYFSTCNLKKDRHHAFQGRLMSLLSSFRNDSKYDELKHNRRYFENALLLDHTLGRYNRNMRKVLPIICSFLILFTGLPVFGAENGAACQLEKVGADGQVAVNSESCCSSDEGSCTSSCCGGVFSSATGETAKDSQGCCTVPTHSSPNDSDSPETHESSSECPCSTGDCCFSTSNSVSFLEIHFPATHDVAVSHLGLFNDALQTRDDRPSPPPPKSVIA